MTDEKRNIVEKQVAEPRTKTQTRTSRNERRRVRSEVEQDEPKRVLWVQIRLLPIWLRIVLVLLLLIGAAICGAMIGYGYVGDGVPSDVLKKETWTHIFDIINGKES